ncbi:VOC family protein [Neogemmobacter tilapiae]|uniref:VOC domain-containing protein n=1 Tax=Neogemmobacter tilapiae TaxID=875041 RepID=A0A918WGU3_9RHOB|nr:VOC family protein [Gemmobacter tilapiae]GHC45339.1 hypothetical protein GCM10007315_03400 [Gemmobacter tilapiae]
MARLEHVNVTVGDVDATAGLLVRLFGWHVRWQGPSIHGGRSVHVGTEDQYLALYSGAEGVSLGRMDTHGQRGGLNHIGLVVDDLEAAERAVYAEGLTPTAHADYEPGRRFYFWSREGVEYEVVSYR